jgi:Skp family chaperone for outer membrane proteins
MNASDADRPISPDTVTIGPSYSLSFVLPTTRLIEFTPAIAALTVGDSLQRTVWLPPSREGASEGIPISIVVNHTELERITDSGGGSIRVMLDTGEGRPKAFWLSKEPWREALSSARASERARRDPSNVAALAGVILLLGVLAGLAAPIFPPWFPALLVGLVGLTWLLWRAGAARVIVIGAAALTAAFSIGAPHLALFKELGVNVQAPIHGEVQKFQEEAAAIQSEIEALQAQLATTQGQLSALHTELGSLHTEVGGQTALLMRTRAVLVSELRAQAALRRRVQALSAQIARLGAN